MFTASPGWFSWLTCIWCEENTSFSSFQIWYLVIALWFLVPVMHLLPDSQGFINSYHSLAMLELVSLSPVLVQVRSNTVKSTEAIQQAQKRILLFNASSDVPLQFGPKSSTRDFCMLHWKLFGAISNRAINQWYFLSCPEGKENRDLNAKFSFQIHQDIVSGLDVFWVSVLEVFKFISRMSMLTQKFNEFRGKNWSLNSC